MVQPNYFLPLPTRLRKSQVFDFAERVGQALDLSIGAPLEPIVEAMGGKVTFGSMEFDERDGGSIVAREINDYTIYLSLVTSPVRDRFTIAHEMGHLFLHLPEVKKVDASAVMRATRWVDPDDKDQQRAEWEANWFAAALLMPSDAFREVRDLSEEFIAAKFNVSRKSVEIRKKSVI